MEIVVHAGTGKAGSTSIQAFCRANRERLAEAGLLYPRSPGGARHEKFGMFLKSAAELATTPNWHRGKHADPVAFRRTFRRHLRAEIEQSGCDRVLLSDEEIFGVSEEGLSRLGRWAGRVGDRLRVVVYLRRQDDHLVSRYQQGVKIGWVVKLSDWVHEDMTGLYDYEARLRRHERLVSPDEIVVRPFEPSRFVDGSLYQDFLDAVGVPLRAADLHPVENRNTSLDAESVEFLRLLNLHRVRTEQAVPGLIDNRQLIPRLVAASIGPTLTLPAEVLDEFMSAWERPNRAVARRYLKDPEGVLFRSPRKSVDTTSQQFVDAARVDHFLSVTELPARLHGPLRELAEQEAGRDT